MRILHIQFAGPYTENMGYQENILPKFHYRLGHEVYMLTSCYAWRNSKIVHVPVERKTMKDGVFLERMDYVNLGNDFITRKIRAVKGIEKKLEEINPDFIMLHDVQSFADYGICAYLKKHPNVRMIVDCHTDFENSATNWLSKNILHKIIWRHLAKKLIPYTEKFYGVLPARVDFLEQVYHVPQKKCDLLVMGADDDLANNSKINGSRTKIREKYEIDDDVFLIVTGGKTNFYRPETLSLMKAVIDIASPLVKLIVFGSVSEELADEFEQLCTDEHIIYAGWIDTEKTYDYFEAADLVVFPGAHSVMWEQAVGQGKACLVRDMTGFHHVDLGGNVKFLPNTESESIKKEIIRILKDKTIYDAMCEVSEQQGRSVFTYSNIAKRSLE